ncbi:MAG: hypothetical protein NTU88_00155 [Armatimonadetes bacterium]|nr:hypothetical protein [Armatimonadota bacterium]
MQKKSRFLAVVMAVTLLAGITITTAPSVGAGLGGILKGAGLVLLVDKFGNQLNDFINKVTFNKGVGVEDRTKVVPIISIGQGAYAGAAQVSGPAAQIDKVKAVAQFETNMAGKTFRIKALVPVESKDIVKDLKRVSGVGVSAMIDVRL